MKKIELAGEMGHGLYALVDNEDFEMLSKFRWNISRGSGRTLYAITAKSLSKNVTKAIGMHRMIMKPNPNVFIDHINHNGLDNRKANLRFATHRQNIINSPKRGAISSSKFKGVHYCRSNRKRLRKWIAQIMVDGKGKYIGSFFTETEAAIAYNVRAKKIFGEFAYLNKIEQMRKGNK